MDDLTQEVAVVELAGDRADVGEARVFVTAMADRWHLGHLARDAALIVSELVSNALVHGRPPIEIRVTRRPGGLRIDVRDGGDGPVIPPTGREPLGQGGLGLRVVAHLATRWGTDPLPDGKSVWAELTAVRAASDDPVDPELAAVGPAPVLPPDDWPEVRLVDIPRRLLLAWARQLRSLMRELDLVSPERQDMGQLGVHDPVMHVAAALIRYWDAVRAVWTHARAVEGDPDSRVSFETRLPRQVVLDGPRFLRAMDRADELSRKGLLLSAPASGEVVAFRRWFVHALVRQVVDGAQEERCPFTG